MDVENLENGKFIASWRLKEKKIEQEYQFQHPPSFDDILFFLFSSFPTFGTRSSDEYLKYSFYPHVFLRFW